MLILSTWLRHTTVVGLMILGLVALAPASQAKTPDGQTPAEETVCDDEPTGALYGLCVAYCEAMDCDYESPHAADMACERVLTNYKKHAGETAMPPCEENGPACTGEDCVEDCPDDNCGGEGCSGEECGGDDGGSSSEPPPA